MYVFFFFFFNDTATTEIYTLSLHDALPIFSQYDYPAGARDLIADHAVDLPVGTGFAFAHRLLESRVRRVTTNVDRKSTRLNSSHANISYAVFCLKKKKKKYKTHSYK